MLLFLNIRLLDILDILLVAVLIYELYRLVRGTSTINIFLGIIGIYLLWKLVDAMQMELLSEILGAFISVGVIALIVVFQPEIRKFLLMVGTPDFIRRNSRRFLFWRIDMSSGPEVDIDIIIKACQQMSIDKTGCLLILQRNNELGQYKDSGTVIDARISEPLILNIFFHNAPLHDGAMIISRNKIEAAGCILPVSSNSKLPAHLGLRHRAAVGITEQSDAVALVVSEESGKISLAENGQIQEDLSPAKAGEILVSAFTANQDDQGDQRDQSDHIDQEDHIDQNEQVGQEGSEKA